MKCLFANNIFLDYMVQEKIRITVHKTIKISTQTTAMVWLYCHPPTIMGRSENAKTITVGEHEW